MSFNRNHFLFLFFVFNIFFSSQCNQKLFKNRWNRIGKRDQIDFINPNEDQWVVVKRGQYSIKSGKMI